MGATGSNRRESRIILTRRRRCGRFPKNHHHGRAKPIPGARHNGRHEKQFEERRWREEMAVGLGRSQKAHGLVFEDHRFAERAERVRILRAIVRRINVVGGTAVFHQFRDDGSRQNSSGDDVRENQVVPHRSECAR